MVFDTMTLEGPVEGIDGFAPDPIVDWNQEEMIWSRGWEFSRHSDLAFLLRYLCRSAVAHGTHLFYTFGPFSRMYLEHAAASAVARKAAAISNFLAEQSKQCTFLNGSRVFEDNNLSNDTHVNGTGALLFTQQLSQELKPFLRPTQR